MAAYSLFGFSADSVRDAGPVMLTGNRFLGAVGLLMNSVEAPGMQIPMNVGTKHGVFIRLKEKRFPFSQWKMIETKARRGQISQGNSPPQA